MYMAKYMVKDAFAVFHSLSVLCDARRHVAQYGSKADDAGTAERTGKHFLQRVLNKGLVELAPTQAAAVALSVPSSGHSHDFLYSYPWDALRLVTALQRGCALLEEASKRVFMPHYYYD